MAYTADSFGAASLYGLFIGGLVLAAQVVTSTDLSVSQSESWLWLAGLALWYFLYHFVSLMIAGRTLGKWLVGMRVVMRDGSPIIKKAAFIRPLTFPLSFLVFGLGFVGILIEAERRALHDRLAGTVVVYDWGDRPAELPGPLSRWMARRESPEVLGGARDLSIQDVG